MSEKIETCENCAPDGAFGTCPRCYACTGLGCPHGTLCDECVADEGSGNEDIKAWVRHHLSAS